MEVKSANDITLALIAALQIDWKKIININIKFLVKKTKKLIDY